VHDWHTSKREDQCRDELGVHKCMMIEGLSKRMQGTADGGASPTKQGEFHRRWSSIAPRFYSRWILITILHDMGLEIRVEMREERGGGAEAAGPGTIGVDGENCKDPGREGPCRSGQRIIVADMWRWLIIIWPVGNDLHLRTPR
jgi:hypothetical protein